MPETTSAPATTAELPYTIDDVNTLRGHAFFLRQRGENDMPEYFDRLATRLERGLRPEDQD